MNKKNIFHHCLADHINIAYSRALLNTCAFTSHHSQIHILSAVVPLLWRQAKGGSSCTTPTFRFHERHTKNDPISSARNHEQWTPAIRDCTKTCHITPTQNRMRLHTCLATTSNQTQTFGQNLITPKLEYKNRFCVCGTRLSFVIFNQHVCFLRVWSFSLAELGFELDEWWVVNFTRNTMVYTFMVVIENCSQFIFLF